MLLFMGKAQEKNDSLPYAEIPEAPEFYNACTVVARMVDGLGFRYYWATEGLRPEDLAFTPGEGSRTSGETLDHILDLSQVILNSALHKENKGADFSGLSFKQKRSLTLNNLKTAADIFRNCNDLASFTVVFAGNNGTSTYPFWNQINGPIEDAIWHCGQIVSLRRSSGNPFNSKVSVFLGTLRN